MPFIDVTLANGSPAIVDTGAVTHVTSPPAAGTPGVPTGTNAYIHVGGKEIAVRHTVAEVKALLRA